MADAPHARLKLDRIVALCDGVVAIVVTLLVLSIEVPKGYDFSRDGLVSFLQPLTHDVVVYAVTFLVVGGYWVEHHSIFHYVRFGSRAMVWLHLVFLLLLSLVPFATQLKATYREEPAAVALLAALHMAIGLALGAIWRYVQRRPWLLRRSFEDEVVRSIRIRILAGQVICVMAVLASFVSVRFGPLVLLAMPLLYVSNREVDEHWDSVGPGAEAQQ